MEKKSKFKFETSAIRTQMERSSFSEHSAPLHLTSSFVFEDAEEMRASFAEEKERNIYSRFSNPNTSEFIQKVTQMEEAEDGVAFASGMGAVFASFATFLNTGDHVLSARAVFGSTHALFTKYLPKWGIDTTYFAVDAIDSLENLIQPNTKCIYVESPTNPGVDILDLEALGKFAKKHQILFIVDNCFATPYLQQPIRFGADLVIHSATKLMDGQGRVLGGITVGKRELIRELYLFARNTGASLSPFNAWVLSKSLETLAVRVDRHCDSALIIAEKLEKHPQVNWVKYPFLPSHPQHALALKQMKKGGNIISFEVKGGLDSGRKFINKIQLCSLSANLGDSRSIITHPSSTTHSKLSETEQLEVGITPGMIRLSVGLEHNEDIWNDLNKALHA
ncbi:aminotransferase class I/II-fold pyridoxal phosphate-dependent enzyme [Flavobacteriaceae bacterium]|jgi:O-succinylhomoserine sulfhydrylase|nr:aminotransferase class I/II-fold pyridoxal phosphate-dependent enzyme [Flavobacteriaceae bacterium]MDA9878871.1 aminotransferase class I/II-fold pyridoxal phosphate-dependent enzyme [Flavobacteriaceae bacterium]